MINPLPRQPGQPRQHSGATLIELIISIVVISLAVASVLLVMQRTTSSSADPMIRHQSVAIAEAYLDEILAKAFSEPGGGETGTSEEGFAAADRANYDDVQDYRGLPDAVVRDQEGIAISALAGYTASVTITATTLGPGGAGQIPNTDALLVTVAVAHAGAAITTTVSGYRTNY